MEGIGVRIVIAGGGTGGHLYPGIALAETFKRLQAGSRILFVGTAHGMEATLLPEKGFSFEAISAKGLIGKGIGAQLKSLFLVPVGLMQSLRILRTFSPQLVIGIGGYAAGPVLLAALLLRIKRIILEPNLVPGLANKLIAPYVDLAFIAFEESRAYLQTKKIKICGVPVRPEIARAGEAPRKEKDPNRRTLLILGGSQGARSINRAMVEAIPILEKEKLSLSIIHQTGKRDWEEVKTAYGQSALSARVEPFIHDMAEVYAAADLVVSRAGAGTLSELAVAGKPSLLIPFPFATAHQEKNAAAFVSSGAAEMILDHALNGKGVADRILALLSDPERLKDMGEAAKRRGHPQAAEEIVQACFELVGMPVGS
jgi:UDP-N-acetylglucosamine--N-acetylmuramyl-(pentapeptide) pyrophosphoryl-undecaprenol N-acetylglucosamine transferase